MIKNFPEFGQLEINDIKEINKLTEGFHHYSDHSFSNLWAWDNSLSKRGFSKLNGNLIVLMHDYKTNEPVLSVTGSKKPKETLRKLVALMKKEKIKRPIRLVPEEFTNKAYIPDVTIKEDRDSFDYIYSTEELKNFEGGKFKQKRNEVNALLSAYPEITVRELDIKNQCVKKDLNCLFHQWAKNKIAKGDKFEAQEESAFNNILILAEKYNLILIGIYINKKMVAFIISEIRTPEYAVGHFAKTDPSIRGINAYLLQSLAKILLRRGIKYFNYEQDMGFKNLREAKERFRPVKFLKKYLITPNNL